jgi:6-phosphogluconolactonase (cycloisomerase 2 family)
MKRLIGCTVVLCLLALTVGCGGATGTGTLAYVSNSNGSGFTVFTVNTNGTLTTSSISPLNTSTPTGDGPKVIQFSANGKWAYFLDAAGGNIYGYVRAGNGTFSEPINNSPFSLGTLGATSLVISPNSGFVYVAEPGAGNGSLATFTIDPATGELAGGTPVPYGATGILQLVITPSGSALYGLLPAPASQVLGWSLSSGVATPVGSTPAGVTPIYMVLAANGSYMYVLDNTATSTYTSVAAGVTGQSPNIYGYFVGTGSNVGTLQGMPSTGGNPVLNIFNENADLATGSFPGNPIGGATSYDSRFLFVVNRQSSNISVFKIAAATTSNLGGGLTEIPGKVTVVDGTPVSTASPFPCGAAGSCSAPSFLAVAKANNALYVLNAPTIGNLGAGSIFQFAIDENTGQLRALEPPSVTTGNGPTWITIR